MKIMYGAYGSTPFAPTNREAFRASDKVEQGGRSGSHADLQVPFRHKWEAHAHGGGGKGCTSQNGHAPGVLRGRGS
eukprot:893520-Amphidinium_carterae.1